ncbi:MAG: hypothetical protein LGB05_08195 [Sulfurovum sp.]|nr:hypothetical protein [Sulfurovum sp.]
MYFIINIIIIIVGNAFVVAVGVLGDDGTVVYYGRNYSSNYSPNWKRSVYKQQF